MVLDLSYQNNKKNQIVFKNIHLKFKFSVDNWDKSRIWKRTYNTFQFTRMECNFFFQIEYNNEKKKKVFANTRKKEDFERLSNAVKYPSKLFPFVCDITNEEEMIEATKNLERIIQEKNLKLYALVNNAGYIETSPLELQTVTSIKKIFEVNLFGQISLSKKILPILKKNGNKERSSRLIFVGSMVIYYSFFFFSFKFILLIFILVGGYVLTK